MLREGGSGNTETTDTIKRKMLNTNEQKSSFFVIADGMMSREKKLRERKSYHLERCRYLFNLSWIHVTMREKRACRICMYVGL